MNFNDLIENSLSDYRLRRIFWKKQIKDGAHRELARLTKLFTYRPELYDDNQLRRALERYRS